MFWFQVMKNDRRKTKAANRKHMLNVFSEYFSPRKK